MIFHDLRGYDSHFIMQEIGKISKEKQLNINCIPNNMEKYDFHAGETYCVIDSMQFRLQALTI